jgi:hypothetical protein
MPRRECTGDAYVTRLTEDWYWPLDSGDHDEMTSRSDNMSITPEWFLERVNDNLVIAALIERLPAFGLDQCYLTAGCLCQTVWNFRTGLLPQTMIKDYDVFYFDDRDLSWEAEDGVIRRANRLLGDLPGSIEIKNQARVHLWYEQRFGSRCPQLCSTREGIDPFLISCTCIGIDVQTKQLYAPNGLEVMWEGILRINPLNPQLELFQKKADDFRSRWPWLTIMTERIT